MTLRELHRQRDEPKARGLAGVLDRYLVDSELLEGNPLGDPARRPLYVYSPPGWRAQSRLRLPSVYLLQGFAGRLNEWLEQSEKTSTLGGIDALIAAGECPPAIIVFVDAWTSLGGAQFLNSSSIGRYFDYLCDEVVPFIDARYATFPRRDSRAVAGKSSGGFGAIVLCLRRPDLFGAFASQAGDALFECCYQPYFPVAARMLRDQFEGSWEVFHKQADIGSGEDLSRFGVLFAAYALGAAYTPDPERPGQALLPFEVATGRTVDGIWERWLDLDPVRMIPHYTEALSSLRWIHLEAGRRDEFFLDLGASAISAELTRLGIDHSLDLFDGGHHDVDARQPTAVRELVVSLARE